MVHEGFKPYSCEICGKSFATRKSDLRRHIETVLEEKNVICGKPYFIGSWRQKVGISMKIMSKKSLISAMFAKKNFPKSSILQVLIVQNVSLNLNQIKKFLVYMIPGPTRASHSPAATLANVSVPMGPLAGASVASVRVHDPKSIRCSRGAVGVQSGAVGVQSGAIGLLTLLLICVTKMHLDTGS